MLVRTVTGRQMRRQLATIVHEAMDQENPVITYIADVRASTPCIQAAVVPASGEYSYLLWREADPSMLEHRLMRMLEFRERFAEARNYAQNRIPVFLSNYGRLPQVALVPASGRYSAELAPPLPLKAEDQEALIA